MPASVRVIDVLDSAVSEAPVRGSAAGAAPPPTPAGRAAACATGAAAGPAGRWAAGPAAGPAGFWAAGPLGRCAVGAAVGVRVGVAVAVGVRGGVAVGVAVRVGVAVGVAVGVGVAEVAVRFSWTNAPCDHVPVVLARALPTVKVTVAPSVPQPAREFAEATSTTYRPWETVPLPQLADPTLAETVVPSGAVCPLRETVP